jgi:uncharacterized membrane protein
MAYLNRGRMSDILLKFAVFAIILSGVFFRFYNIDKKVYWNDEVVTTSILGGVSYQQLEKLYRGETVPAEYVRQSLRIPDRFGVGDIAGVILNEHVQNTPLYYILLKKWVEIFGDSVAMIRTFSSVISLLALPMMYWLCMELFLSRKTAIAAVCLLAVSPFHILYAQEARPYSLVIVAILFSSAALLRLLRKPDMAGCLLYTITLILGLYSHLLFILVAISHFIYVLWIKRMRISLSVKYYLGACAVSAASFLPWAYMVISHTDYRHFMDFTALKIAKMALLETWAGNVSRIFFDLNLDHTSPLVYSVPVVACFLLLVLYALWNLIRNDRDEKSRLFVLILSIVPAGTLAFQDLFLGGCRSHPARYLVPSVLGVEIMAAYLFAGNLGVREKFAGLAKRALFIMVICGGVVSCAVASRADAWWTKYYDSDIPAIARNIDLSGKTLIIVPDMAFMSRSLSLSFYLRHAIYFKMLPASGSFEKDAGVGNAYFLEVPDIIRQK